MSTRNLIQVIKDGKVRIAQYGQWDGYPTGQGADIAKFIHEEMDKEKFLNALNNVLWMRKKDDKVIDAEIKKAFPSYRGDGWLTLEQSDWYNKQYPELSRNTGAGILKVVQDKEGQCRIFNSSDFACEYHYVIDMDKETVSMNGNLELPFSEWTIDRMQKLKK